jgi:hypothetical protein
LRRSANASSRSVSAVRPRIAATPGADRGDRRMPLEAVPVGQLVEPAADAGEVAAAVRRHGQRADEARDALVVAGRLCGADRRGLLSVGLEPVRRPPVQLRGAVRLVGVELAAEKLAEERVVAVPAPLVVERDEEGAFVDQRVEPAARLRCAGDGAAQRRAELVEARMPAARTSAPPL